ncbi:MULTISPECIES: type I-E CRISPR-associated endonuclease Cas1e [Streptomyces]|uniref:CRISPR-associated endonuclease Cas1 n=1 Tax=Streptomyces evansiae TaxID=3075535 RepID=A0ABU2QYG4_9ACTN|nr:MULTISPECIES: type I-E CRISPR-associated endonuclease Cas1e [unclassified Streptomyces]MDT0409405.1 type I-E CRISPR-associated endonuclease Cas1e [Streptomyces sp. DSM 41979]MYQ59745.1 type I-E CRISPR-associated endonuclease Cas1 [Streptomyces sp. SID4926]SCE38377.1 CRISP-associated protein Cas1 [Streptomyces sp. DfronAA-171]
MATVSKRPASGPRQLTRVGERLSFVYLERCTVHRDANALTAEDAEGVRHIPSATIGCLLLGPGTRITHQAMAVLGESGAVVVWVGEHGVRFYAGGRALNRSSALLEAQATAWANQRARLDVARAMYRLRFPDEDPAGCTRRQLLGREGDRVKRCYAEQAARTGVPWHGRRYTPGDFNSGDAPNQAVTAAAQCMYGIAQAVVTALGCTPGLGFVHSGHELSFVLDVADFYKTDIGIPVAFEVAAEGPEDIGSRTRRALRDRINSTRLLDRCVRDIQSLLAPADTGQPDERDRVTLHSDRGAEMAAGRNHGDQEAAGDATFGARDVWTQDDMVRHGVIW